MYTFEKKKKSPATASISISLPTRDNYCYLSIQQTYFQSFSIIITNKMKQFSLFFLLTYISTVHSTWNFNYVRSIFKHKASNPEVKWWYL